MPRKFKLYWDKHNKYWFKKFDGRKVYFGKGTSKYLDTAGYAAAVAKYEEFLESRRSFEAKNQRKANYRIDSKGERPKGTIGGCIDRYYVMQSRRHLRGKISTARLKTIRSSLRVFERFTGKGATTKTYEPDGARKWLNYERFYGYFKHLENRVTKGAYVVGTAHQHWCIALDFLNYCWENEWINTFPRGLNRHKFPTKAHSRGLESIKVFSVKQVRELFLHAHRKSIYPMDCWVALALNCGFTSVDIGTLKFKHLVWDGKRENIIRIEKERTKTKQFGSWRIWKVTNELLKRWLKQRGNQPAEFIKNPELVFYGRRGKPVNAHVELRKGDEPRSILHRETGYINDAIGRAFKYKIKDHFPGLTGLGFKTFRKSGVSELVKLNLPNTLLIEQLYLAHKPTTIARSFYTRIDADTLDEALEKLEGTYALMDLVETPEQRDKRKRVEYNARKNVYQRSRRARLKSL